MSPRTLASAVFSVSSDQMLLFGGVSGPSERAIGELWLLDQATRSTTPGGCTYSIVPSSASYTSAGGTGVLNVRSQEGCPFPVSISDPWISPSKKVAFPSVYIPGILNTAYDVAQNGGPARTGSVVIGSATHTISQGAGVTSPCSISISPSVVNMGMGAGTTGFQVAGPVGCTWSVATPNVAWARVSTANSGSGNGAVTIAFDANTGPTRSVRFNISGKTFRLTQAGSTCGAEDVTSQVSMFQGGFFLGFLGHDYLQEVTITNTSNASISGPLFLLFEGLPRLNSTSCPYGCTVTPSSLSTCNSPSGTAYVAISPSGLNRGASMRATFTFLPGITIPGSPLEKFSYSPRVIRGAPNR